MTKKIKVLILGDHGFSPSGCGSQIKYICEALLKSGKFVIRQLGGAIKHADYRPFKTKEWEDNWIIFPVDGYGNKDIVRSIIRMERPDVVFIMTDPRFWTWLWEMEDEIRTLCPIVYYHVWDNYPYPTFNSSYYYSNDYIATISKLTNDIIDKVSPEVEHCYLPHAVNTDIFKSLPDDAIFNFKKNSLPGEIFNKCKDKFIFFFNSRNARRKQSGSLIFWFKDFLDIVGHEKAMLIMHTDPKDPNGQDLEAILEELQLTNGEVMFSREKQPPEAVSLMYNMIDCTMNISDAEGFGLSCLESLACERPVIATITGGLQEQITDGENWFGIGIEPSSKSIIGSQEVPWIYEDRISGKDVVNAMLKIFNISKEERKKMGKLGREHVIKNYNFEHFNNKWVELMFYVYEKFGSWENRKNYKSYELRKI